MQVAAEQWIPLSEAARRVGVSQAKLSRMVKLGQIKTKRDPKDERKTLVDLNELNAIFYPREQ
jgi:DNA-binding MarR family transcriptional regulator